MAICRERAIAVTGVVSIHAVLLLAILFGLAPTLAPSANDEVLPVTLLALIAPVYPQRVVPVEIKLEKDAGASAAPAPEGVATPIFAPEKTQIQTPIAATARPSIAVSPRSGAAVIDADGAGANGNSLGDGRGRGSSGAGEGNGDTPPRWLKGHITNSDYPSAAAERDIGGTVTVRYVVELNGRVSRCLVARSSGDASLDATTCRLIEKRWRYAPSRDERGAPVEAEIEEDHEWVPRRDDRDQEN